MEKHIMKHKYQQGDVLLVSIPENEAKEILTECKEKVSWDNDGKVVLALGEATGHHHRFEHNKLDFGVLVSTVHEIAKPTRSHPSGSIVDEPTYYLIKGGNATLYHEEHNPLKVPPGLYRRTIVREFNHLSQVTREVWD